MEEELEGDSKGDFKGDFKQDMEGDLLSSSGQVRSRSGLVQVWFSLQPKFNSFDLDSDVGRLVLLSNDRRYGKGNDVNTALGEDVVSHFLVERKIV